MTPMEVLTELVKVLDSERAGTAEQWSKWHRIIQNHAKPLVERARSLTDAENITELDVVMAICHGLAYVSGWPEHKRAEGYERLAKAAKALDVARNVRKPGG